MFHCRIAGNSLLVQQAKIKREERKLARQRQLEAKRAAKLQSNAPAKKVVQP